MKKTIAKSQKSSPLEMRINYKTFTRLRKEKRERRKVLAPEKE